MKLRPNFFAAGAFACLLAPMAGAAAITPGNLVVYRVGTGAAALGTSGTAVYLDEYTTSGTLVQSISVASNGAASMTAVGNASTEGIISLSQDGSRLVFGGYRANAGATGVTATNHVVGFVKLDGLVDTSIAITDVSGSTMRSATTVDGTAYYLGLSTSVRYVGAPGGAATSLSIDARNSRQVQLYGNTLYASNGSTAITGKVQSYGTLPTGAATPAGVVTLGTGDAVNGFAMMDLDNSVAGVDTIYALSTVANQLIKWTYNGSSWSATGSVSATNAQNVVAMRTASGVDLFMTSGSAILKLSDNSGFGGALSGTSTSIATAGTNTAFRGIGTLPVPEPASLLALSLGALGVIRRRRTR